MYILLSTPRPSTTMIDGRSAGRKVRHL